MTVSVNRVFENMDMKNYTCGYMHSHTIATHTSFLLVITMTTIDNHAHFGRNMAKKSGWLTE